MKHEIPVLDGRRWCQGRTADAHGIELPYNVEITPWLHITPDLQVIVRPGGGFQYRDTAIVYGLRAQITF